MASRLPHLHVAACQLPLLGPFASIFYAYRQSQLCGRSTQPPHFPCSYIASLDREFQYAQLGLVNSLLTLAATVAGVASGLFSNPFLIGSLLLAFGAIGVVHQTILSQIDEQTKSQIDERMKHIHTQKVA